MRKEEFVSKLIEALQCYYSPMIIAGTSIDLTFTKALSYMNGARMQLDNNKMNHLKKFPFIEEKDGLCFPFTIRLYEVNGTYIVVVGEPDKDVWYDKALVIHKHKVDAFPINQFERPETN